MISRSLITFTVLLALSSCSRLSEEELLKRGSKSLAAGDTAAAIADYERLINDYPESPSRPGMLYALGSIYQAGDGGALKAIENYRKLVTEYPTHAKAPTCLFLIGFVYNNQLKDLAKAKEAYEEFLTKYPNDEMAVSAKFELQFLGKDPTEILKAYPSASPGAQDAGPRPAGK